jgi:hypothetical protein
MRKGLDYLDQLTNYLKRNLKKGYTKESLKWALVGQGHPKLEIERAFKKVEEEMVREAPLLRTKPKITYEVVEPEINVKPEKKKSFLNKWFSYD